MVPDGWVKTHLKDILAEPVRNGYSPVATEKETGFWVLILGALSDDGIKVAEIKSVEPTGKVLQSILRVGDFLVSRSNTQVGRSIRFKGELENCSYPASMLSAADCEIEALQQKLDYLKQEKKALMQQLLTGKRRVTKL